MPIVFLKTANVSLKVNSTTWYKVSFVSVHLMTVLLRFGTCIQVKEFRHVLKSLIEEVNRN